MDQPHAARPPRRRTGPTPEEVESLGIVSDWDGAAAQQLRTGDKLLWIHTKRAHYTSLPPDDEKLIRELTVTGLAHGYIMTDYGKYRIENGRNQFEACGCKRFCDCYGRLYLYR